VNRRLHLNWAAQALQAPHRAAPAGGGPRDPNDPEPWAAAYCGLDFKEFGRTRPAVDCWGLVRLPLAEVFGCETEPFASGYASCSRHHVEDMAGLIAAGSVGWAAVAEAPYWRDAQAGIEAPVPLPPDYHLCPLGAERPGDVLLIRQYGQACHVGLVAGGGNFLHIEERKKSLCESYRDSEWRRRIVGIYRHPNLVAS
jgi:cell wall-associated NlpC family hydrolase